MPRSTFFENNGPLTLAALAEITGAALVEGVDGTIEITDVAPIGDAVAGDVTYYHDRRYRRQLGSTEASAVFLAETGLGELNEGVAALVTPQPELAFARAVAAFYPDAVRAGTGLDGSEFTNGNVHPTAVLEEGVTIAPGALIGPGVEIGGGTEIGPNTVVGPKVKIGRDCVIGAQVTLLHSLVGDRVIIHAGTSIGQDGFGYTMGPAGFHKIPQIGRVVLQNDVEIGANGAIDRGALEDTVIGEGSKLDNLIQIAHAVQIGRNCAVASQTGISGSATIGDQVLIAGQVGILPQVKVGDGAVLTAGSGIPKNVEPGAMVAGRPFRPIEQHHREWALLSWLVRPENRPRSKGKRGVNLNKD